MNIYMKKDYFFRKVLKDLNINGNDVKDGIYKFINNKEQIEVIIKNNTIVIYNKTKNVKEFYNFNSQDNLTLYDYNRFSKNDYNVLDLTHIVAKDINESKVVYVENSMVNINKNGCVNPLVHFAESFLGVNINDTINKIIKINYTDTHNDTIKKCIVLSKNEQLQMPNTYLNEINYDRQYDVPRIRY